MPDRRYQGENEMYTTQMSTFLTVCEKGSFTKAAAALFITPSAVLQQINTLEQRLGVTLFIRTKTGIKLTEAGEYLKEEGGAWVHRADMIRADLHSISANENTICIGTSVLEKARLLYSLWMLYSGQNPKARINMTAIGLDHGIPAETDLIESINSGIGWMKEWEFMEICRMPFGFGFDRSHPFSTRKELRLEELRGETVIIFSTPSSSRMIEMYREMEKAGVLLQEYEKPENSILWESAFHRRILLCPLCWKDILGNMTIVRCRWNYTLPYGIFYRKKHSGAVKDFLRFIRETYTEGNSLGMVPVFDDF
jgi:DNA-binding transcriptional LysR family regulator